VLHGGLFWDHAEQGGALNLVNVEVRQGLDIFDASDNPLTRSRFEGNNDFTSVLAYLARYQPLFWHLTLLGQVQGQGAFDQVLAAEEFTVGGPYLGRGYDTGEIGGDQGVVGSLELRYDGQPVAFIQGWQPYVFYDIGKAWEKDGGPGVGSTSKSLASAGGGVRLNFFDHFSGYVQVTKPLTLDINSTGNKEAQFDFLIRVAY